MIEIQKQINEMKGLLKQVRCLILDCETTPNQGWFWRPGNKQAISHKQIIEERKIICISYKWAGYSKVHTLDFGLQKQDDTGLLKTITKLINQADIVVGQNHDRFDLPWIQGRLFIKGLAPIKNRPGLITLDTLKLARGSIGLNSYRLDYMSKVIGRKGKIVMEIEDWLGIIYKKDKKCWNKMLKYCPDDVKETEELLYRQLPYVKLTGFLADLQNGSLVKCPECKSIKTKKRGRRGIEDGKQRRQCRDCNLMWTCD